MATAIRQLCQSRPALSLLDVLEGIQVGTSDDVYALIAGEQLYVDLAQTPLADPAHVQVFVDQEQAAAYKTLSQSTFSLFPGSSSCSLLPGTMLWWDGKPWRILNLGETAATLLSPEKQVVDLPIEVFEDLLRQRKVTIATPTSDPNLAEEHELLTSASPEQLEIATSRYKILGRSFPEETVVSARTLQRWRMKFRTAEAIYGHGFLGLIPGRNRQGNHLPRLSQPDYVYYWSDEFRPATIEHTQLPVRYDPFDIGTAFAFVKSRWVKCISEYYLQFKGHSERELLLATTELRKRRQEHAKHTSLTAKRLAEFLASTEAHEVLLTQRLQDAELQDVFAQMGGMGNHKLAETPPQTPEEVCAEPLPEAEEEDLYADLEIYKEYR